MLKIKVSAWVKFVAAVVLVASLPACRIAKNLNSPLVVKNKFEYIKNDDLKKAGSKVKDDLKAISALKPNKRVFGAFPFKMWLYYSATRPRPNEKKLGKVKNNFRNWMRDKVGEAPVQYDTEAALRSSRAMTNYLNNNGFFYAQVTDTVLVNKHNKATVIYRVNSGPAWKIGKVTFPQPVSPAEKFVMINSYGTKLLAGKRFNVVDLKAERERIETDLRKIGFYYFTREYITFDFDTVTNPGTVNTKVRLNNLPDGTEHRQYRINNIYVVTDYNSLTFDTISLDTIQDENFYVLAHKHKLRKNVLKDAVYFAHTDTLHPFYSVEDEQRTLRRLSDMGNFKYINIEFKADDTLTNPVLNCIIKLTQAKKQVVSASGEANISNEGFFGVSGTLSYKNRNISKRADLLAIDLSAGLQFQLPKKNVPKTQIITTDAGANISYYLNKFLIPFKAKTFTRNNNPKTRFNLSYAFQNRFDFDTNAVRNRIFLYQLHNFSFGYGYDWININETRNYEIHHLLNPINVNFYLLPKVGPEFLARLNLNSTLKSSFEEQIIIGPSYSFIYNDQAGADDKIYSYLRTNLETAGNLLFGAYALAYRNRGGTAANVPFKMFNRVFSQFFKIDIDYRNYFALGSHAQFALRTFAGAGVPYGNSTVMPFVRQYFVGGPNSLRGFLIREIGPGSYADPAIFNAETGEYVKGNNSNFFNQTGDIKLEMNAELRFDIFKFFKGALFADAGNVWLMRFDYERPGANFDFTRFWREFAVNVGAGVRLDFSYFVIRLDYGIPIRDPRIAASNKWKIDQGQFQLAIGYPF